MNLEEIILDKKSEYEGVICKVNRAFVKLSNDQKDYRESVEFEDVGCVAVINNNKEIILINEYKFAQNETIHEVPYVITPYKTEEDFLEKLKSRLAEKTGITAKNWIYMGKTYFCPGYLKKTIHMFVATDLTENPEFKPIPYEVYEINKVPLEDLGNQVLADKILDAKTLCCAYRLYNLIETKKLVL